MLCKSKLTICAARNIKLQGTNIPRIHTICSFIYHINFTTRMKKITNIQKTCELHSRGLILLVKLAIRQHNSSIREGSYSHANQSRIQAYAHGDECISSANIISCQLNCYMARWTYSTSCNLVPYYLRKQDDQSTLQKGKDMSCHH